MQTSMAGGGFFFKPFNSTQAWGQFTAIPNPLPGVFGLWAHLLPAPTITLAARWIEILVFSADMGAGAETFNFQLGIGTAGSEQAFLPTTGNFRYRYDPAIPCLPHKFSFPFKVAADLDISLRCMSDVAGGDALYSYIFMWN